jgi:hypothetical protein
MEFYEQRSSSLCELLDRVLNTGVVATGDIVISVAGIDLIYLNLQLLLTSVETARASKFSVSPCPSPGAQTETRQEML